MGEHFASMRFGTYDFSQVSLVMWLLIGLALAFDFLNGFHDTANSIATVVSTRVLNPMFAAAWAAFFNFAAFVVFPLKVAATITQGVIDPQQISSDVNGVIFATLLAACIWNVLTWWLALPTSSSHALIGGLIGSGIAMTGSVDVLVWSKLSWTLAFIILSPLIGFSCGLALAVLIHWVCRSPDPNRRDVLSPTIGVVLGVLVAWGTYRLTLAFWPGAAPAAKVVSVLTRATALGVAALLGGALGALTWWGVRKIRAAPTPLNVDQLFRRGQLMSAAWFSLTHGGNDAQKTMGIIFILLAATRRPDDPVPQPFEVVLACHLFIGLGTMFGGWRIVKTMGQKIIKLRPVDGFCAENGAGLAVALATGLAGIPVSTTHTVTGSIIGVGSLRRLTAVRWGVAGRVVWAWLLTIPGSAMVAVGSWWVWDWAKGLLTQ